MGTRDDEMLVGATGRSPLLFQENYELCELPLR